MKKRFNDLAVGAVVVVVMMVCVAAAPAKSTHALQRRTQVEQIVATIEAQRAAVQALRTDEHSADEDMEIVRRFHEVDFKLREAAEMLRDATKRYQAKE